MFQSMIDRLRDKKSIAREEIIHTFSPYYICDHFFGDELHVLANELQYCGPVHINKQNNDLLRSNNFSCINDYDIIYVQVNFFERFCLQHLDRLGKKIVLMTGQWHSPQILRSPLSDRVLNHPNIVLWVSQNPIYHDHPKYMAFPYGVEYYKIDEYANVILNHDGKKANKVKYLPVSTNTHPCRFHLPVLPKLPALEFFTRVADTQFLISPIGDRNDGFRHWEAIGLGAIPICNLDKDLYECLFTTNMKYSRIEEITKIVKTESLEDLYVAPNRDLICLEYHKKRVLDAINAIRNG